MDDWEDDEFVVAEDYDDYDYDEEEEDMDVQQLHDYGACSSVILKNVYYNSHKGVVRLLYKSLSKAIPGTGTLADGKTLLWKRGKTFYFSNVCVSTVDAYTWTNEVLKALGFATGGFSYNAKNDTMCALWVLPVPLFVERVQALHDRLEMGEGIDWNNISWEKTNTENPT